MARLQHAGGALRDDVARCGVIIGWEVSLSYDVRGVAVLALAKLRQES